MNTYDDTHRLGAAPGAGGAMTGHLVVGGLCGITWAAGLRGWMAQLALGEDGASSYSWMTLALVLLPGLGVGVLLGYAAYLRHDHAPPRRWLVLAPVLFATALLDPEIFRALITNGQGGGALIVVATALAGGFTWSRRGWSVGRVLTGALLAFGLFLIFGMGGMAGPAETARGAWVMLYGLVFMLLLSLAAVLPYRPIRPQAGAVRWAALGGLCGLAWACALRSFMAEVAGFESAVHWGNTWGYILLPGLLIGALLGLAEHYRRTGGRRHWRWLVLSPFLFAAVLVEGLVTDPANLFAGGIGAGTVAIPALAIIGGHALSARGPRWSRALATVLGLAALAAWPLTGAAVGGASFAMSHPQGVWAAVLYDGLLVLLALATSGPLRRVRVQSASAPAAHLEVVPA